MKKLFLKVLKSTIISSIIVFSSLNVNAQMRCRSILGSHLSPINKDIPLLWAVEGTMAPGIMSSVGDADNAKLNGGMILGALDYTFLKKHHFYFEGGFKIWENSELTPKISEKSKHLGIRQVFYSFNEENTKIKVGLHEMKLGNYFLVDERVLGISVDQQFGAFSFHPRVGTVIDDFARMGRFCGNRHLYNLITTDYTEKIGEKGGETNLAGIVINWNPSFEKEVESSDDEFSTFNEFEEKKALIVEDVGIIFYQEFGKIIQTHKQYFGSLVTFNLPAKFNLLAGGVFQNLKWNNTLVYIADIKRIFIWNSGENTEIGAAFIGKYDVDNNAKFQPLFSNLFLGEIMRLDATDFPLWKASVNHDFKGKLKFNMGIKAVGQIEGNNTSEIDFETAIQLFGHSKITAIFSHVKTDALPNDINMLRLELKVAF